MNEHDLSRAQRTSTADASLGSPAGTDLQRYVDYTVVDREDKKVGTVDCVWQDASGQPAYVGVKTGWLGLGKSHLIPAHAMHVSEATRKIRLPYSEEVVKEAPSFDEQYEVDDAAERRIADHYGRYGFTGYSSREASSDTPRKNVDMPLKGRATSDEVRMPLSQEEVKVGKREVEAGGVRLRKIVRTETVNKPVELQREEIVVERVPAADRPTTRSEVPFREEDVYVPLRREEAVVEKTARTTEEVRVGKKRQTDRHDITDTVRKEDVDIERRGDAKR